MNPGGPWRRNDIALALRADPGLDIGDPPFHGAEKNVDDGRQMLSWYEQILVNGGGRKKIREFAGTRLYRPVLRQDPAKAPGL